MECRKAQPKEVMLPANLAKTRAAGPGAYGELLMLTTASTSALRFALYPLPALTLGASHGTPTIPVAAIAVAPAPVHYSVYDVTGCKRVFTAPAATTLRPSSTRSAPALSYSMSDLLGIQSLEIPTFYTNTLPTGLGL